MPKDPGGGPVVDLQPLPAAGDEAAFAGVQRRITEATWDAQLAPALREHGVAVVEERVTGLLLDDLAGTES
ncbi:DUF2399 domain-containing protein [Amycolatopsis aidingensis]|uniref:DUF2399 domain-containing protein n=1 Tax=Amycolatopsis aidingensis TaxID=2842453 RepID=UPI001C0E446F|nr:DUF2399 domain-containing protein [Amycolatopsis aidingensis]